VIRALLNNGTEITASIAKTYEVIGQVNAYLSWSSENADRSDAFASKFILYDLQKLGLQDGGTKLDGVAEWLLRGLPGIIKNEVKYNPDIWAEWAKGSGVVGDSTGLSFTADGINLRNATLSPCYFKSNTKYGVLFNMITNTSAWFELDPNNFLGAYLRITGIGNIKNVFTSKSTISTNSIQFLQSATPTNINGMVSKIKDIRIFQLPAGSQIESDFNNLTADQLAVKYPFGQDVTFALPGTSHVLPNLIPPFTDPRWKLHANAVPSVDGNTLTLNATAGYQASTIELPVLPNNKYELSVNAPTNTEILISDKYNSIALNSRQVVNLNGSYSFTTLGTANKVLITFRNGASTGCVTWSNLSLKLKM
jgi:hypothetical protein